MLARQNLPVPRPQTGGGPFPNCLFSQQASLSGVHAGNLPTLPNIVKCLGRARPHTRTTSFPPLTSPLLILSSAGFTLSRPSSTAMIRGAEIRPASNNRSSHDVSARPTAGTSWNNLTGTVCSETEDGMFSFGSPVNPTRCPRTALVSKRGGVDGGDNDVPFGAGTGARAWSK